MRALAEEFVTEQEYWAQEESSPIKHEYFNGRLYAMAGASRKHALLAANALASLVVQLRGKPCRAVGSDQRVRIEESGLNTYPDIVAYCAESRFEPRNRDTLLNATLIIEVLSPSTANYGRTDKFDHYKRIATLCDYLLVSQDRVRIEHFHRGENGDWILRVADSLETALEFSSINCALALRDVYDDVDFEALPLRPPTPEE